MAKKKPPPGPLVLAMTQCYSPVRPSPRWVVDISQRAQVFLAADSARPGAKYLRLAADHAELAQKCIEDHKAAEAAMMAAAAMAAVWEAEMIEARARWYEPKVAPRVEAADKRTQRVAEFAQKGNKARSKYSQADKDRWKSLVRDDADLRRLRKSSARDCAKKIAARENLPHAAVETIRKVI